MKKFDEKHNDEYNFIQQYLYNKGIKIFGEKGKQAALKELKQQHTRKCFAPISIALLSRKERERAQQALMYLAKKRDGTIKGRMVYNGKPKRKWLIFNNDD